MKETGKKWQTERQIDPYSCTPTVCEEREREREIERSRQTDRQTAPSKLNSQVVRLLVSNTVKCILNTHKSALTLAHFGVLLRIVLSYIHISILNTITTTTRTSIRS